MMNDKARRLSWCVCGLDWWVVTAVQVDEEGVVVDFHGDLRCARCGEPWHPVIRPGLRIVPTPESKS